MESFSYCIFIWQLTNVKIQINNFNFSAVSKFSLLHARIKKKCPSIIILSHQHIILKNYKISVLSIFRL